MTIDQAIAALVQARGLLGGDMRLGVESWDGQFGELDSMELFRRSCGEDVFAIHQRNGWTASGKWPSTDQIVANKSDQQ